MSFKINHTPYRGKIEPIEEIFLAAVTLHENHLESFIHYSYTEVTDEGEKDGLVRTATLIPKSLLVIERGRVCHELDKSDEMVECVHLYAGSSWTIIRCASDEEADAMYKKIKNWMTS